MKRIDLTLQEKRDMVALSRTDYAALGKKK